MKKIQLKFYMWLMGITGAISAWAWRKHVKILKDKQVTVKRERFDDLE